MSYAGAACAAAAVLLALGATEVSAQDKAIKSRFTSIDLKSCDQIEAIATGSAWSCGGLPDFPVFFAEVGSRQVMSFGSDPQHRRAARQTLSAMNNALDAQHRATVEWRFERRAGRDVPYAAIVRYRTTRDGIKGEVLVVTKIAEHDTCHGAYIDAVANANAIALARSWADREARRLDCSSEPKIIGDRGKSPM
jgi:hypothetical protein